MSIFHDIIIHNNGKGSTDLLNLIITSLFSLVTVIATIYIAKNQIKLQRTIAKNQSELQKEISSKQSELQQNLLIKQQNFQDKIAEMQREHEKNLSKDNEELSKKLKQEELRANIITTQRIEWMNKVRELTSSSLKTRRLCVKCMKEYVTTNDQTLKIELRNEASKHYQNLVEIGLEFDLFFSPFKLNRESKKIEKNQENITVIKKRERMNNTLLPILSSKSKNELDKHLKVHNEASKNFRNHIRFYLKKEWDKAKEFNIHL